MTEAKKVAKTRPVVVTRLRAAWRAVAAALTLMATVPAFPGESDTDLAKKLSNPVADLISIPFQFNYDQGYGPADHGRKAFVNVQPVFPFSISQDWNLITRTILPIVNMESPADGVESQFGLGDTLQSFFFSPKAPVGGWIVGAGPVFLWPTSTSTDLGSEKWGAGPTVVVLQQRSGWTYGILGNHVWSYAGHSDRADVNATFLQPFVSYTFPTVTTLGLSTESTYDWTASQWTVPINLSASQLLKFGKQPVSLAIGPKFYVEGPSGGPDWGLRFTVTLLFPK